ncbi:MAG: hypothetical protein VX949_04305 [Planctomycetota bacterium]|nr:hypothetical protein [Planctomycetota bacterium]
MKTNNALLPTLLALLSLHATPLIAEDLWIMGTVAQGGQRTAAGQPIEQTVWMQRGANTILAFSFGIAIDPALGSLTDVAATTELLTSNAGSAPDFIDVQLVAGGFTVETLICAAPCSGWDGSFFSTPIFEFSIDPVVVDGSHVICFSDGLGSPPVPISVTNSQESLIPTAHCATVCITEHQAWEFAAHDETVPYDVQTGNAGVTVTLTIGQYPCQYPMVESPGFSFSLVNDATVLEATSLTPADVLLDLNNGSGPDFMGVNLYPGGVTLGIVASLVGSDALVFEGETDAAYVHYQANPSVLIGSVDSITTILEWSDSNTSPTVSNYIMPGDASVIPGALIDGIVTFEPVEVPHYIRGDVNEDGTTDLADPIVLLSHLFGSDPPPSCDDAGDANTDGTIDVADPVWLLSYLFSGGAAPLAPFPGCGSVGLNDCPISSAVCP